MGKAYQELSEEEKGLINKFFVSKNLKYLTQSDNRLPSLYFENTKYSGRIRQEHPHEEEGGPVVEIDPQLIKIFCKTDKLQKEMYPKLKELLEEQEKVEKQKIEGMSIKIGDIYEDYYKNYKNSISDEPVDEWYQIEIDFRDDGRIHSLHRSDGKVILDQKILDSYKKKIEKEKLIESIINNGKYKYEILE